MSNSTLPTPSVVADLHGRFYRHTMAGRMFHGTTAGAGVVIPIYTTLTPTFSLWNPSGSEVNCVLVQLKLGWSATTAALGSVGYTYTANAGSGISSTAPFVAFGSSIVSNGIINGGNASKVRFAGGGTTTLVAAPVWFREAGISVTATTAATATGPMWMAEDNFHGSVIVPPGNAIHVMGSTAIAITATMSLSWIEIPTNELE